MKKQRNVALATIDKKRSMELPHYKLGPSRGVFDHQRNRAYKMAYLAGVTGASLVDLAGMLKISRATLGVWMRKDSNIVKCIQRGLDQMVVQVEIAATKRACGYDQPFREVSRKKDITGKVVEEVVKTGKVHVPGDAGMQRFLLSKRASRRFPQDQKADGVKVIINMDKDDESL